MNVVAFEPKPMAGGWSDAELDAMTAALAVARHGGVWATGVTENGDAQFYVLCEGPEQICELCVSRVGDRYILEDGVGRLLFEHRSLPLVALHARSALRITRWWLVARVVVVWCTIRHVIHDKIEPLLTESEDLLVHLTPQLAALG